MNARAIQAATKKGEQVRLSSLMTFTQKFLIPLLVFGFLVFSVAHNPPGEGRAPLTAIGFIAICFLGSVAIAFQLKRVTATSDGLLVSNYFREEFVPYSAITDVSTWLWYAEYIEITVDGPFHFAPDIRFIAYQHSWFPFWEERPATTFLKSRMRHGNAAIG